MCEVSIKPIIGLIEIMFDDLNSKLFESALSKPVITLNRDNKGKKGVHVLGWCTLYKAWQGNDGDGYYEINITCDYLDRDILDIAATLLHEMIHLFCVCNGIKDTSRAGVYHNKKYKECAENHGLLVSCDTKRGWNLTELNDDIWEYVCSKYSGFELSYSGLVKGGSSKKSSTRKYVCPFCGVTVRVTKEVKILCYECDELMRLESDD